MSGPAFAVELRFSPALQFFLPKRNRGAPLTRILHEKTSIKDAFEACGVPHPEVNFITCGGVGVGLDYQLQCDAVVELFGVEDSPRDGLDACRVNRFVADGHLGKLTRDLRLLGFDVLYSTNATDGELVEIAAAEERALLTRDRRLLMHKVIRHGYCPRSHDPDEQIVEVIRRFHLEEVIAPFTRCIACGDLLARVAKADVFEQLEPLTKIYYEEFRRCSRCGKIYWSGSHFGKLEARIAEIRARLHGASP